MLVVLKIIPTIFMALFPVINPIGTALILSGMTRHVPQEILKKASRRIALYTFLLLTAFFLFGFAILDLFGITVEVVQVTGGLVLAAIGWNMLMKGDENKSQALEGGSKYTFNDLEQKLFYPATFPLTVSPGGLAVVLTFGARLNHANVTSLVEHIAAIVGILIMCLVVYICYANVKYIDKKFSATAATAVSKMVAFFVICIGVEIFWSGFKALYSTLG